MSRLLAAVLALLFALPASAQTARAFRVQVEASMVVLGHVDIGADGRVDAYRLDAAEDLPGYVTELFDSNVPGFRFEPLLVDGVAVPGHARMSARIVARKADGTHVVSIRSVHFSEADASDVPRAVDMGAPRYPADILRAGGQGTVYALLRLGPDGVVQDVAVEQVNLAVLSDGRTMERLREGFAKATLRAARDWRFAMPAATGDKGQVIRVPVSFVIGTQNPDAPGAWSAYVPGPYTPPKWAAPAPPGFTPDALAGTQPRGETSRFRLLAPPGG